MFARRSDLSVHQCDMYPCKCGLSKRHSGVLSVTCFCIPVTFSVQQCDVSISRHSDYSAVTYQSDSSLLPAARHMSSRDITLDDTRDNV